MADLVAIVALLLQYSLIVFLVDSYAPAPLPAVADIVIFFLLAGIGIVLWHRKEFSQTARQWVRLTAVSVVVGIAFFGVDLLVALLGGQANPLHYPGGLLALPLTLLVCPGGTIICVAGLVRTLYIARAHLKNPSAEG